MVGFNNINTRLLVLITLFSKHSYWKHGLFTPQSYWWGWTACVTPAALRQPGWQSVSNGPSDHHWTLTLLFSRQSEWSAPKDTTTATGIEQNLNHSTFWAVVSQSLLPISAPRLIDAAFSAEIPEFLSEEECRVVMQLAQLKGLMESQLMVLDGQEELAKELNLSPEEIFTLLDINQDGQLQLQEVTFQFQFVLWEL